MSFFLRSFLASTATVTGAVQSHPDHSSVALSQVVVTAHPYARGQADLAQPTSIVAGRQLALRQAASLGELLATEPGITSTWFGPGASRPIVRGLGGDRLRVLQNGTGTFDASGTSPDHAVAIDPLLIERVEIVRGPASLLYGSSAVGGAVNVITHRIHQTAPGSTVDARAAVRAGSVDGERSGGAVFEGGTGAWAWHVDAYRRTMDEVRIPGFAWSEPRRAAEEEHDHEENHDHERSEAPAFASGRIPNTSLVADGGAAGLSWIGTHGYVGFAFSGHNSVYGVPPGGHVHGPEDSHPEPDVGPDDDHADDAVGADAYVRIDLRQRRLDLEGERRFDGHVRAIRFKVARTEYRHLEREGGEVGTVFLNDGGELRLEALHAPLGGFSGALGVHATRQDSAVTGEEAFLPAARSRELAGFVFEEATTGPVTWQIGGRLEHQDLRLRDGSGREDTTWTASASAGLVWHLNETWSLAAAVNRTERPPNVQERFADGPHPGTQSYEVGNASLGREQALGWDVTLRRRLGRISGELTVFSHRFGGYIFEQPTDEERDGFEVYRYVQHDARLTGAELAAVVHLHDDDAQQFDLTLAADVVRGRNTSEATDLPRMTPARLRVGLDWARGPFTAGLEAQRVLAQERTAPRESPTDGYTLWSAHVGYRLVFPAMTADLFLRGTNLTDEEARLHTSFLKEVAPLPGRGVAVGVTFAL